MKRVIIVLSGLLIIASLTLVHAQYQYVEDIVIDYDSAFIGWISAKAWGYDVNDFFSDYGSEFDSGDGAYISSFEVSYYYYETPPIRSIGKGHHYFNLVIVSVSSCSRRNSGERYYYRVEAQAWGYSEVTGEDDLWTGVATVDARWQ